MRCSEVIDAIVIARCHVRRILANKARVITHTPDILMPRSFADPCFSTDVYFHTQLLASVRKFKTLHCCNKYTFNMAAVIVVNRMTLQTNNTLRILVISRHAGAPEKTAVETSNQSISQTVY